MTVTVATLDSVVVCQLTEVVVPTVSTMLVVLPNGPAKLKVSVAV